jgi:hypothetical protein
MLFSKVTNSVLMVFYIEKLINQKSHSHENGFLRERKKTSFRPHVKKALPKIWMEACCSFDINEHKIGPSQLQLPFLQLFFYYSLKLKILIFLIIKI